MLLSTLLAGSLPAMITPPKPLVDGYGVDPVDPVVRTDMEAGAKRSRRRSKVRNDMINVTWSMSDQVFLQFRDWFDSDEGAGGGANWFVMPLAVGTGGVQAVSAKFSTMWKSIVVYGTLRWKVTATLEVR